MTKIFHAYLNDQLADPVTTLGEQTEQTELKQVRVARTAFAGAGEED